MSKTKKSHKSSDSESETSEESSSSSSESAEELEEKREKKRSKQKDKKKKKHKHRKAKSAKKKSKHNSGTEDDESSESSSESEKSSEDERKAAKKKFKKELNESPVRVKREERSRSREKDKYSSKSKWESPPRRERSRSREKYRKERSRSRERHRNDRSRSRNRDRSRDRNTERYRGEVKRERDERRDYRGRDRDQAGSYERRERSPRRERDRSRDRNRERDYVKREPRSPNHARGSGNRFKQQHRKEEDDKNYEWGKPGDQKDSKPNEPEAKDKEKPNFALSGALTEDANKVNGVVVKYAEPPEARKPKRRWRLYPFKGETALPVLHIHRQSCFLVGRDRKVVDLAVDHPSCSKQHAALQYRLVPFEREDGTQGKRVRLYLIDLDSANGTFLNNKRIDARKYYELMEKDVIKFGFSTREYVLLHENSKEDQEDDDIEVKEEPMDN